MELSQKLKVQLPYDLVVPLLDLYSRETKISILWRLLYPVFIGAIFKIIKKWKQPKCPSKKMWYVHTMEYYSATRENLCCYT